jgi:transcriptional regulator with XRE-family HTH domain
VQSTAEILRELRRLSGRSLRDAATLAATSAPTLSAYESGKKEPRLSTLQRLAESTGFDVVVSLEPRMTTPERRTLALHRAVAEKFRRSPQRVRARAIRNLKTMRAVDFDGYASKTLDEWERLLKSEDDVLSDVLISVSSHARSLRQSSPFAGVLSDNELRKVLNEEWRRGRS